MNSIKYVVGLKMRKEEGDSSLSQVRMVKTCETIQTNKTTLMNGYY